MPNIVGITKTSVEDFLEVPASSAGTPPAGQIRVFADSATNSLSAVNSAGVPALPSLVAAPAHYGSSGTAGSIAVSAPSGSPPVGYFFVCVATAHWLRVGTDGTVSFSF
jgi:hypothetical protein